MRSRCVWAFLAVAVTIAGSTVGQDKDANKATGPRAENYPVEVRFADDSSVKAALLDKSIDINTRYGKLTVPVSEIRSIEFGLRIPEETAKHIATAVRNLASADFAKREAGGSELLELREVAFPAVQQAARSTDAEVSRRAREILKTLAETVPAEKLHLPRHDTIVATEFTIVGQIETPALKARTPYFGETSLKLAELRAMRWQAAERDTRLAVDAARYGGAQETWLDTGIKLRVGASVQVMASGQVDLRPQDPGVLVVGPDGRQQPFRAGRGGGFGGGGPGAAGGRAMRGAVPGAATPGALVGRIGEFGKMFVIGSQYEGTATDEGKLYLRILPAPASGEASGAYEVRVLSGR
jgi:hypothetical protein